jgi:hypothetical protein
MAAVLQLACSSAVACSLQTGPTTAPPAAALTVLPGPDAVRLAVATSALLFRSAPTAVLAVDGDGPGQAVASAEAERLKVPMLLVPTAPDPATAELVGGELARLGTRSVVAVGAPAETWARSRGLSVSVLDPAEPGDPAPAPVPASSDVLVLSRAAADAAAATSTARAAGAEVHVLPVPDPRADARVIATLRAGRPAHVVALGQSFGPPEQLERRLTAAAADIPELPGGGRLIAGRRMVALYGNPTTRALGSLGEQDLAGSIRRVSGLAQEYRPSSGLPVIGAFEIITTVASTAPGPDGDFSNESAVEQLRPWVDAAREAGIYVVLDLQPGTADFLSQARRYQELLVQPHVGLALDPEWRLAPGQRHLAQIGSVGVDEVNRVIDWLAGLTAAHRLPQKLLMIHQFRTAMIADRARLDTGRDEVAVLVHADGFGSPSLKLRTWNALRAEALPGVGWGWKNFIDEDRPMLTPAQTLAVSPDITFVSYQ